VKKIVLALALVLAVTPALARVGRVLPPPIEEAPVERAIANVTANTELTEAQRERLLGRLHLIGYAQRHIRMRHYATGEWTTAQETPCGDEIYNPGFRNSNSDCLFTGARPRRELPQAVGLVDAEALAHLRLARAHYARAVAIDGGVLRARLGLAYVLDELNADDEARVQLREIIAIGVPRLQRQLVNAEDHAILSEAVEHLSDLALTESDRRSIA